MTVRPNQLQIGLRVNFESLLWLAQKAVPLMVDGGHIVAMSSLGSSRVLPAYGAIGPTKSALESLVRYLAYELRPRGILVNAVSGGLVLTDAIDAFPQKDEVIRDTIARTPAGRAGEPRDLARIVGFLVSPAAEWICGQTIVADGGLSLG